jgi:hypothetical protein
MTHDNARIGAWVFAGIAGISLAQAALIATVLAGTASFILALISIYDRLKYGPKRP